ncbi:hypothetical protein [Bartonella raoultii]|uniref:hypothetical protein n=1 Tax=Bartonella raoultii TaxID=1457020 RepID=UPI001ABAFC2B|nr:hypothetical protein [Bartonella raoultii]
MGALEMGLGQLSLKGGEIKNIWAGFAPRALCKWSAWGRSCGKPPREVGLFT